MMLIILVGIFVFNTETRNGLVCLRPLGLTRGVGEGVYTVPTPNVNVGTREIWWKQGNVDIWREQTVVAVTSLSPGFPLEPTWLLAHLDLAITKYSHLPQYTKIRNKLGFLCHYVAIFTYPSNAKPPIDRWSLLNPWSAFISSSLSLKSNIFNKMYENEQMLT